jgi:hypothetical protein
MMMHRLLKFASFTLDLDRLCLRGPSGQIDLRPKSFEVLRYLVEHAGRVGGKEEIIKAVWPGVIVTDESLTRCISEVGGTSRFVRWITLTRTNKEHEITQPGCRRRSRLWWACPELGD